jgi:sialidase-1
MYQRYPAGLNERTVKAGDDPVVACSSYVTWSDDDGVSWHAPRNITGTVKGPDIQSDASGPGVGIELTLGRHRGRLLFPFNEGRGGSWTTFSVYSDDAGATWRRGDPTPKGAGMQPNEVQFAELSDGTIYLNARNQAPTRRRLTSLSRDAGATWTKAQFDEGLEDPICEGSVIKLSSHSLAFSNPESEKSRVNGVLKVSSDDGRTWSKAATLKAGSFGYSCLVRLSGHRVGILYESVEDMPDGKEAYRILYEELETGWR